MRNAVKIENIEEMRRMAGIDDVELREDIRRLRVGDMVKLTVLADTRAETLAVQITRIRGSAFRGKLVATPASAGESNLRIGSPINFTTAHIHSLPRGGNA